MTKKKFMYGILYSKFTTYDSDVFWTFCCIGGIVAGLLALPSIYGNPMKIFYAVILGAFVCGSFFVAINRSGRRYCDPEEELGYDDCK